MVLKINIYFSMYMDPLTILEKHEGNMDYNNQTSQSSSNEIRRWSWKRHDWFRPEQQIIIIIFQHLFFYHYKHCLFYSIWTMITLKWTETLWLSEAYKNVNIWQQLQFRPMQIVLTFTGKETRRLGALGTWIEVEQQTDSSSILL